LKVAIIGAGSIGNHLSYSARKFDWNVSVFDQDSDALKRFKEVIYPSRYGKFDTTIDLNDSESISRCAKGEFDAILIGTPPDSHLTVLKYVVKLNPKIILIEKPICPPIESDIFSMKEIFEANEGILFLSGYNHRVSLVTQQLVNLANLFERRIEKLDIEWLENWSGILKAHPWLKGPGDTYLGSTLRGGGALFEHSHGLDLWLQITNFFKLGSPTSISAHVEEVISGTAAKYDESVTIKLSTDRGFQGKVIQDVVTTPPSKKISLCGDRHIYVCKFGSDGRDSLHVDPLSGAIGSVKVDIQKSRPSDFDPEIAILNQLLSNSSSRLTPLDLGAMPALFTAYVGKCAIDSARSKREISIDMSEWGKSRNA
jgi:predicted dehydrogenase